MKDLMRHQTNGSVALHDMNRAKRIVADYRGWDALEKIFPEEKRVEVIDSDISGIDKKHQRRFKDRNEVFEALTEEQEPLRKQLDQVSIYDQRRTLYDNLEASRYFLEHLKFRLDLNDFIENTMGVRLMWFDEWEIRLRRGRLLGLLHMLGYKDRDLGQAYGEFRNDPDNHLPPDVLKERMSELAKTRIPRLRAYLGLPEMGTAFDHPEQLIRFVHLPGVDYRMESYYRGGRQWLVINTARDFLRGEDEYFVDHEICAHALDHEVTRVKVGKREVIPEIALKTLHGPFGYASEGVAQTLPKFLPKGFLGRSRYGLLAYEMRELRELVLNNGHLMINEPGDRKRKMKEAVEYTRAELQIFSQDEIKRMLIIRSESPLERTYNYIYGVAILGFSSIAQKLKTLDKKKEFLTAYYGTPLTPDQVTFLVDQIAAGT